MSTIDPTSVPAAQDAPLDPAVAIEHVGEASAASASAEQSGAPPAKTSPPTSSATAEQTRGRPFERGQSGNPLGRPRGSRNRATQLAEALIQGHAEDARRQGAWDGVGRQCNHTTAAAYHAGSESPPAHR
jgi:Family of unknown function (DUF5681)